jgi:transposase-like protein
MNESIMKTDRLGRLRYAPEQKAAIIEAYLASGMSAPRFAALHGVNYQTLVYWIKKSNPTSPQQNDTKLLISSPGQATLAAALIRELHSASPC